MSAFVDTNVLVYAADKSGPVPRKTRIARELLLLPAIHLSVQVLNEFSVVARKPNKLDLDKAEEREWIKRLLSYPVHDLSLECFLRAQKIHTLHQISHWDSLIVASAQLAGCETLYSEDMQDDHNYEGVVVRNPFSAG
jgi:predicted nucleic acid-binding protein